MGVGKKRVNYGKGYALRRSHFQISTNRDLNPQTKPREQAHFSLLIVNMLYRVCLRLRVSYGFCCAFVGSVTVEQRDVKEMDSEICDMCILRGLCACVFGFSSFEQDKKYSFFLICFV